jgi:hypothetical protein
MKRLRTLKSFKIFKSEIKTLKPISVDVLLKGFPMITLSCRSKKSGRTVPLNVQGTCPWLTIYHGKLPTAYLVEIFLGDGGVDHLFHDVLPQRLQGHLIQFRHFLILERNLQMENIKNQMFYGVLREENIWLQLATHMMNRWSIQQEMLS